MEKLSPNRAQLFVRNKYTVFTMGGTVALRSVNKNFSRELQFCRYNLTRLLLNAVRAVCLNILNMVRLWSLVGAKRGFFYTFPAKSCENLIFSSGDNNLSCSTLQYISWDIGGNRIWHISNPKYISHMTAEKTIQWTIKTNKNVNF